MAPVGAAWLGSILNHGSVSQPAVVRMVAADAFVLETAAVILLAPIAGAAATRRGLGLGLASFLFISFALATAASLVSGVSLALSIRGHLALAVVALALAAIGAAFAAFARNTLDAAAAALLVAVLSVVVLLAGGPRTADLTERTISTALLANPLIAVTAAAELDLLRSQVLYTLAPISHRRFTYPAWHVTAASYGTVALAALAFTFVRTRQKGSTE
jgi:hypothetical protein